MGTPRMAVGPDCSPIDVIDSIGQCGFNVVQLATLDHDLLSSTLQYMKPLGLKAFIVTTPDTGVCTGATTKHNISRFAGGVYIKYTGTNDFFSGRTAGHAVGSAIVCDSGDVGFALRRNEALCHDPDVWWKYWNALDCWMPMCSDSNTAKWWLDSLAQYKITFNLKYENNGAGDTLSDPNLPICKVQWQKLQEDQNGIFAVGSDSMLLKESDFTAAGQYQTFSMQFTRKTGQTRWMDYPVWSYGNKKLYVEYVEVQDAIYDSLATNYNNIYSQAISNIAESYSDTSAVFRFYMWDEPMRSHLDAYQNINNQLLNVGNGIPGFTFTCPLYPPGMHREDNETADTTYYSTFMLKTGAAQLAIDILPLFGDSAGQLHTPKTPVDSGLLFQKQLDLFCKYNRAANKATKQVNKPWWIQLQSFGDSLVDAQGNSLGAEGRWRLPTPRELRCMANLALAHGAKGIFYYLATEGLANYFAYEGQYNQNWKQVSLMTKSGAVHDPALYNEARAINANLKKLAPTLLNLVCDQAFRKNAPAGALITQVSDSLIQVGLFHNKTNTNDKYFMLVNRHCLPNDTLTVTVNINYSSGPFFVSDMLTDNPASGQLAAGTSVPFSYKLQPGEGRLFKIMHTQRK